MARPFKERTGVMNSAMEGDSLNLIPDYDALPEPIKLELTQQEYLWLGDAKQASLIQDLTEPEWT
jgi:hypothetical protein